MSGRVLEEIGMRAGETDSFDCVVVGSGLGGLVAAVELAKRGRRVALIEKAKQTGGRAISNRREGVTWNLGPHALYCRGIAARALRDLGIAYTGSRPNASGGFAIAGGRTHALPGGFVSLLSTSLLGLPAKLEMARMLSSFARIDARALGDMTFDAWLAQTVRHESVRAFLRGLVRLTTYCDASDRIGAGDVVEQIQMALSSGVLYVDGGWQTLVDGLTEAAVKAGVTIEQGVAVREIEIGGGVRAVRLGDNRRLTARTVIAAVEPRSALALGGASLDPRVAADFEQLIPVRAACLDLALSRLPVARATFALGIDRPLYFSVHSAAAKLAPEPMAVIHVAKYLRPGAMEESAASVEKELECVVDMVQPGWRALVTDRRFLPSMTVTHALPTAARGGLRGRPAVDALGIAGLYLAGDWVGDAGMIADAAVASGRAAAARCEADLAAEPARAA